MKDKVSTSGIVFSGLIIIAIYVYSQRFDGGLPSLVFWLSIIAVSCTIIFQIYKLDSNHYFSKIILVEIVITAICLHSLYIVPYYGLSGAPDSYADLASVKSILFSGHIMGTEEYVNSTSYWPSLHIISIFFKQFTNAQAITVAKYIPMILSTITPLMLFLLIRHTYKSERIALSAVLVFVFIQPFVFFHSFFVREIIALPLFISCIYLYSLAIEKRNWLYYLLSGLLLVGTIMSHHLTSLMLVLYLFTHYLVTKFEKTRNSIHAKNQRSHESNRLTITFPVLALIMTIGYWIYVYNQPIVFATTFIKDFFENWGQDPFAKASGLELITSVRRLILTYGFYAYYSLIAMICVFLLFRKRRENSKPYSNASVISGIIYFLSCCFIGFLILYLIPTQTAVVFPDRFLIFAWICGAAIVAIYIELIRRAPKKRFANLFLLSFILFNLYIIPQNVIKPEKGVPAIAPTREDYSMANRYDLSDGSIVGTEMALYSIWDIHNTRGTRIIKSQTDLDLEDFDWLILSSKAIEYASQINPNASMANIEAIVEISSGGSVNWNNIYSSNDLSLFVKVRS